MWTSFVAMDASNRALISLVVSAALLSGVAVDGCSLAASPQPGRAVSVGGEVTVADVTWRILDVRRTPYLAKRFAGQTRADGIFILLDVRAQRQSQAGAISWKPLSISDSQHHQFDVDAGALVALDEAALKPLATSHILPKTPVEGWIVFDVPRDARGLRLKILDMDGVDDDYAFIRLP